jgi:hypothetical protein
VSTGASVIVDEADGAVLVTGGGRTKLDGAPRLLVFAG